MEQARNYVCKECSTPVPSGHKFCGRCGGSVPQEIVELQVRFFGAMQSPGKARLILIRGEGGIDGLSYSLQGTDHVAGRADAQILYHEDYWLSAKHANFVYRGDKLFVPTRAAPTASTSASASRCRSRLVISSSAASRCSVSRRRRRTRPVPIRT